MSQKQEKRDCAVKDPLIMVQNLDNITAGTTPFKSEGMFSLEGDMNALKIGTPGLDHKKVQFKITEASDFKKGLSPANSTGTKNPKLKKLLARKKFDSAKDKMRKTNSMHVNGACSKFDLNKIDNIDDKFDLQSNTFGYTSTAPTFDPNFIQGPFQFPQAGPGIMTNMSAPNVKPGTNPFGQQYNYPPGPYHLGDFQN